MCAFYRQQEGYLIRFQDLADFHVSGDGEEIKAWLAPGGSSDVMDQLYLNQVLPLAQSLSQRLVLHGSAVSVDDYALAFLGPSGRGKSTLAASFASNQFEFLSDDGLVIDLSEAGAFAQPSHPSIRLWDDSQSALIPQSTATAPPIESTPKQRFLAGASLAHCSEPRILKRVYFLGEAESPCVRFERVGAREALAGITRNGFFLDSGNKASLATHFARQTRLAALPIFFRIDFPRDYSALDAVRAAIIAHAQAES